jgi:hypothetical protein
MNGIGPQTDNARLIALSQATSGRKKKEDFRLQLGAGVGVDFAVQANFFKSGRCPLHNDLPVSRSPFFLRT